MDSFIAENLFSIISFFTTIGLGIWYVSQTNATIKMKQENIEKEITRMDDNGTSFGRRSAKELQAHTIDLLTRNTTNENEIKNLNEKAEKTFRMMDEMIKKLDTIYQKLGELSTK